MPPYFAHLISAALRIAAGADSDRRSLSELGEFLRTLLREAGSNTGTSSSQIVPVMLGDNEVALHFAAELRKNGFTVRAIRPPNVSSGTSWLRRSLTTRITREQVNELVKVMTTAREKLAVSPYVFA